MFFWLQCFLFHLKSSFRSYLTFCLDFLLLQKILLNYKDNVNFNVFDVTNWLAVTIHLLPNISRSKGNQTMKFDQVIEHNKKNIFLQKSITK